MSSAADVLGMSVVRGMRGAFRFYLRCISVFGLPCCGWCKWGVGRGRKPGTGGVGCCFVCVSCEFIFFV